MTLGDAIRQMTDEELADFLTWSVPDECTSPETGEDLPCRGSGCALKCPYDRRTENMLKYVKREWSGI